MTANGPVGSHRPDSECAVGLHWVWDGVSFEVLYPFDGRSGFANAHSCVIRIEGAGGSVPPDRRHRERRREDARGPPLPPAGRRCPGRAASRQRHVVDPGVSGCRCRRRSRCSAPQSTGGTVSPIRESWRGTKTQAPQPSGRRGAEPSPWISPPTGKRASPDSSVRRGAGTGMRRTRLAGVGRHPTHESARFPRRHRAQGCSPSLHPGPLSRRERGFAPRSAKRPRASCRDACVAAWPARYHSAPAPHAHGAPVLELVHSGGWLMVPIILCSIAATAIVGERLWSLQPDRVAPRPASSPGCGRRCWRGS